MPCGGPFASENELVLSFFLEMLVSNAQEYKLKRIINSLDKKVDFTAQIAAVSLLRYPSLYCCQKVAIVHHWSIVTVFLALLSEILENGGGYGESDEEQAAQVQNIYADAHSISSSSYYVADNGRFAVSCVDLQASQM